MDPLKEEKTPLFDMTIIITFLLGTIIVWNFLILSRLKEASKYYTSNQAYYDNIHIDKKTIIYGHKIAMFLMVFYVIILFGLYGLKK